MVRDEPEVPVYRQELARALDRLGVLAARRPGGRPEAERLIRQALALCDRLAADSPDVPPFREDLALILLDLADVVAAEGRPVEAEPFAARSVALFEELVGRSPPGSASVRRRLVWRSTGCRSCSGLRPSAGRLTPSRSSAVRSNAARR